MHKKYFIQTFGCQMNQADSEKVHMVLLQSGFFRAWDIKWADLVIFNTCSVRQKWEDRVFWMLREIEKENEVRIQEWNSKILTWVTGCMVKKTGLAKKYIPDELRDKNKKRKTAKVIDYLSSKEEIFNFEDKLFPRSNELDFVFRIEESKYVPHILSQIYWKKIGQEDKYDDYLKQIQQRENPFSASIIIQTGCDNYCSFCIVPYTRGAEVSRNNSEILSECQNAVKNGAKEITLLGQNVNSYGKQKNIKLWNAEKSKWNNENSKLKIGIDLDDTLFVVLGEELLQIYNQKFHDIVKMTDINTFNCGGIDELMQEYHIFETKNAINLSLHTGWEQVLKKLKLEGHQLYIITSREIEARENTQKILEKYFWIDFFKEIIFIHEFWHDNKYSVANKYHLDIVIDDAPHHINAYKENFLWKICIFHAPWNRSLKEDNKRVFRIHDWFDFEKLIPKLSFTSPFQNLLEEIDEIQWLDRIRFTSSNPHDMTRDILDSHFDLKNTCNYLHFALQSWSNQMLKKMNRRHSYEDFKDMIKYLRWKDPLFSISTDIIVWFSGETEEMFQQTVRAFKECEFDNSFTARYSVRANTIASKVMPDDVPDSVKAERWHILNNLLLESVQKRNTLMLGRTEKILISGEKDNYFFGRTRNFKEVYFPRDFKYKIWDIVPILITQLDKYVLKWKYV